MATNKRPRKAYKRIGFEDRKKIEALNAQGKTVDEMAMAIGVHSATMYRELARGGEPYKAEVAQHYKTPRGDEKDVTQTRTILVEKNKKKP